MFECSAPGAVAHRSMLLYEVNRAGWPAYRHRLADVKWERWNESEDVDEAEIEYDGDEWMGPTDHEAIQAAAGANRRGTVETRPRRGSSRDAGHSHGQGNADGSDESCGDDEEWTETKRSEKSRATEIGIRAHTVGYLQALPEG